MITLEEEYEDHEYEQCATFFSKLHSFFSKLHFLLLVYEPNFNKGNESIKGNPSSQEPDTGKSKVWAQPGLGSDLARPCLKKPEGLEM